MGAATNFGVRELIREGRAVIFVLSWEKAEDEKKIKKIKNVPVGRFIASS